MEVNVWPVLPIVNHVEAQDQVTATLGVAITELFNLLELKIARNVSGDVQGVPEITRQNVPAADIDFILTITQKSASHVILSAPTVETLPITATVASEGTAS